MKTARHLRLHHRIFLYFSLLLILSTILFGYYAYQANVRTAEENLTSVITGSMAQTAKGLGGLLETAETQANLFAASFVVQDSMANDDVPVIRQYDRYMNMERVVDAYEKNYETFGIRVFFEKPRRFFNDGVRYFPAAELPGNDDPALLFRRNFALYWLKPGEETADSGVLLSVIRNISSSTDFSISLGSVAFDVRRQAVAGALAGISLPADRKLYLFDESGRILYNGNGGSGYQAVAGKEPLERIRQMGKGSLQIETDDGPVLLVFYAIGNFPFYLAADIPLSYLTNQSNSIFYRFFAVALVVLSISFVLAYLLSRGVTSRLKQLMHAMGTVENYNFNLRVPAEPGDEVGILTRKFNWMIERIRTLIQDVYQSNYERKEAELKLLQAQINPHFLYNTLNSVHWLAVKHEAPEISYMVRNLSDFLRFSLHVDGTSTLRTELMHTRAYFNIQKYRFEDRIVLIDEVDEALYDMEVLPLILQPLVENAILHGVLKAENIRGIIRIRGWLENDTLRLEVADNGLGMDADRLAQVIEMLDTEDAGPNGTGLRNVHRRIRFRFDEPYGLKIDSSPGQGTRCVAMLPARCKDHAGSSADA